MGLVFTEITLSNLEDGMKAKCGFVKDGEVRSATVRAIADTGAWTLVLTEETARKLGVAITGPSTVTVAGGEERGCQLAEPVRVRWKDRSTVCEPVILPGETTDILGAIPMEGMDLVVCPKRQEVVGAHGDKPVFFVR